MMEATHIRGAARQQTKAGTHLGPRIMVVAVRSR